jgi:hypothetical protein
MRKSPWNLIFRPAVVGGNLHFGMVERAGIHLEPLGDTRIVKFQWSAAVRAERAFAIAELQDFRDTLSPNERAFWEKGPRHERRTTRLTAVAAMTKAGLHGWTCDGISDGTAEATAVE